MGPGMTVPANPLAGTYTALTVASPVLNIDTEPRDGADGWFSAQSIASNADVVAALVDREQQRITETHGVAPPRWIAATWALHRYAFTAVAALTGPWYLEQRVPVISLPHTAFHPTERRLSVARIERLHCSASDPLAGEAVADIASDPEDLAVRLRTTVADRLAPILNAFRGETRRGDRALWGLAADELADSVWHIGRVFGTEDAAVAAVTRLLPHAIGRFPGGARFIRGPHGWCRTQLSCCLYYAVRPAEQCAGCPRGAMRTAAEPCWTGDPRRTKPPVPEAEK